MALMILETVSGFSNLITIIFYCNYVKKAVMQTLMFLLVKKIINTIYDESGENCIVKLLLKLKLTNSIPPIMINI